MMIGKTNYLNIKTKNEYILQFEDAVSRFKDLMRQIQKN